jgi:hypothetical protein
MEDALGTRRSAIPRCLIQRLGGFGDTGTLAHPTHESSRLLNFATIVRRRAEKVLRKHNNCPDLLPMKSRGTSTKVFLEPVM